MPKHKGLTDPALLELLYFFEPPVGDFSSRSIERDDLIAGLQRSPEFRRCIMQLRPFSGRTGWSARTAQDMCRMIEARLAALSAIK